MWYMLALNITWQRGRARQCCKSHTHFKENLFFDPQLAHKLFSFSGLRIAQTERTIFMVDGPKHVFWRKDVNFGVSDRD
jgi:hypothetical protein